jgi:hypothetical protein
MRWLWSLAICGCYSPSPATGVPCAPLGSPSRCPAAQICVTRGGLDVCEPEGATGDIDAASAIDAMPVAWWDPAWSERRAIDVVAGSNGVPAGYSLSVTLDHKALVAAGLSLASGDDIRVVRDELQLDRALDTGASWSTSATTIWFKTTSAVAANATVRYWVYYGNPSAAAPPQDPTKVFLYSEGFEGSASAWGMDNGVGVSTARAHHGTHALAAPAIVQENRDAWLEPIDEMNVAWDVWWNIDDLTNADMSQYVRGNGTSVWLTNLQPPAGGGSSTWDIAKVVNGEYSEVIPPPSGATSPPVDTWFRVTVYAYNDRMAVDVGGTRYVPASSFSNIGTMSQGDVGFGAWSSAAQVWFDDATLRRFVLPEPVVTLGAPESR